jgi:hypothetical protein
VGDEVFDYNFGGDKGGVHRRLECLQEESCVLQPMMYGLTPGMGARL